MRSKHAVQSLELPGLSLENGANPEVTALRFEPASALQVAVGTSRGKVHLYDMRRADPIYTLNHQYRLPINSVQFHKGAKKIITSDSKIIKLFD